MIHEVLADGVVPIHGEGDFQLGAHAIDAGDEHRLLVSFRMSSANKSAEAADFAEHFAAMRRGEQLRQRGFDFVAEIDVHAGARVSFLFHCGVN